MKLPAILRPIKRYKTSAGLLFVLLIAAIMSMVPQELSFARQADPIGNLGYIAPPDSLVEVNVRLYINKIYNVDSVQETYNIDGYIEYEWQDERLRYDESGNEQPLIFENDKALDLMKTDIWIPAFEFMNIQGRQETQHFQISIDPDGTVTYEERFFGIFHTEMNFRKFPFDYKKFVVKIEPFSYARDRLKFSSVTLMYDSCAGLNSTLGEDWELMGNRDTAKVSGYARPDSLQEDESQYNFSQANFEVHAKRKSEYYVWQVLFPIFLIILASWSIFWIRDFGTQIGIGFSLMLTVVAFNFYSASILPRLPYNTFIEYVIMVGYILILIAIVAAIFNHNREEKKPSSFDLLRLFRWLYLIVFILVMLFLYVDNIVRGEGTSDIICECPEAEPGSEKIIPSYTP